MALLIATPALLLPGVSSDTAQMVILLGLFAAVLTAIEYTSSYPCLYEFRDAPPFNRIRFIGLFLTVFLLAVMMKGAHTPSLSAQFLDSAGQLLARLLDFPYSPVRLVVLMLPEDAPMLRVDQMRAMAGLSFLISGLSLIAFSASLWLTGWPLQNGSFNVWTNLPTFDPTSGGEVVTRLRRDSAINLGLGIVMPFLIPSVIASAANLFGTVSTDSPQTLIWTVTAWAFLPASLLMRGIAMGRIAHMIRLKRRQTTLSDAGLLPA